MPFDPGAKILLVDDRPENLVAIEAILSDLGCELIRAGSGLEALRRLLDDDFAVILLDVQMPGMDGFETARLIRSRARSQHTPILFITAINKSDVHVSRGYAVGAVDYLFKPFNPDLLKAKVAAFVELWRKTNALQEEVAQRRQAEERLAASHDLLETISRALVGFIGHSNPSVTFHHLLSRVLSLTGSEYGFIGEMIDSAAGRTLKVHAVSNQAAIRGAQGAERAGAERSDGTALHSLLEAAGGPLVTNEPDTLPALMELPLAHPPLESFAAIPICRGELMVGVLGMANRPGGYGPEMINYLEPLRNTCASIIEAYRNEQRRQEAEEEVRRLNEQLEARVIERTAELERANQELETEIAERRRAEHELRARREELFRAKELAEIASRAKSQFLASMSHELRTPLNAIIGFSELLEDQTFGPLNERQQRYVANILTSGRHLLQLINDILDLSKIEAGRLSLEPVRFEARAALAGVETIVKELAARSGVDVQVLADPDLDTLRADQAKFKQIMYNLLSNAIKFTPSGGSVRVTAHPVRDARVLEVAGLDPVEDDWLEVSVADTGIGIRLEDQERIFQEFEQVDSSYARRRQGTGLGLALTRRLIEMHGGRLWVESEGEGKGSTFTFVLPTGARAAAHPLDVDPVELDEEEPEPIEVHG